MADQNQNINVQMNMGNTFNDLKSLEQYLNANGVAVATLAQKAVELNRTNQGTTETFQAFDANLRQVTVQVQRLGDTLTLLKLRSVDTGEAQRRQAEATREASQVQAEAARTAAQAAQAQARNAALALQAADRQRNIQSAIAAAAQVRAVFPAPKTDDLRQLAAYEAALKRIETLVASGKLSGSEASRIGAAVANGQVLSNLSTAGTQLQKNLAGLQNQFNNLNAPVNALSAGWSKFSNLVERFVIRRLLFIAFQEIQQGIKDFFALELAIGRVTAAAQSAGLTFQQVSAGIRGISTQSGFERQDVANAALLVFQQRATSGAEAMAVLSQATILARASGQDLQQSTASLIETMNAFGISNSRAAETMGILYTVSQQAHVPVQTLGADFARLAPVAQSLGVDIGTLGGFILQLTQHGQTAQRATQTLQDVLQHLLNPSQQLQRVLRDLGFESSQQAISALGLDGVLARLQNQFADNKSELEKLLPGIHNISTAFDGSARSLEQLRDNIARTGQGAATAISNAAAISQNKAQQLAETFKNIKDVLSDSFGNIIFGLTKIGETIGNLLSQIPLLKNLFHDSAAEAARFANIANQAFSANLSAETGRQDAQLNSARQRLEQARALINQSFEAVIRKATEDLKTAQDALKATTSAVVADLNDKLKKITDEVSEAHRIGEQAKKALETGPERSAERRFQSRLSAEGDPTRAVALIDARIREQRAAIEANANRTDEASFARQQQRLQDLIRLEQERLRLQETSARQRAETTGVGLVQVFNPNTQQFERRLDLSRQVAESERRIADIERQQAEFLGRQIALQAERERTQRIAADQERARNTARELALREIERFRVVNENGEVLPQFRRGTSEQGRQAAETEFRRLQANLQRAFTAEELRILQQRYGLQTNLENQLHQLRLQLDAAYNRQASTAAHERTEQEIRDATAARQRAQDALVQRSQSLNQAGGNVTSQANDLITRLADSSNPGSQIIARIRQLQQDLITNQRTDTPDQREDRINQLIAALEQFRQRQIANTAQGQEFVRTTQALLQAARDYSQAQRAYDEAARRVDALTDRFNNLATQISGLPRATQAAATQVQSAIGNMNTSALTLEATFVRLIDRWRQIQQTIPQATAPNPGFTNPGVPNSNPNAPGGPVTNIPGLASGGWVPGSGFGDTQPAMLTPGEFVVNKDAAQRFAPIVEALNRGMPPDSGAASGFSSVTNVGDITVNVVGGKHSDQTARDIAYGIRREIRRGTISQDQLTN